MLLKEDWFPLATAGYHEIIEFILERWSEKEALEFILAVEQAVLLIKRFPLIHPESPVKRGIRRCVIRKRTSLYYRIKPGAVEILAVVDNRSNPSKLRKLLRKT